MSLSVAQVYSVRFGTKLSLPQVIQDSIAKLRITAATYKPVRHTTKHHHSKHHHPKHDSSSSDNWRIKSIAGYVSRVKDNDDPDYHSVFGILNKVNTSNLNELSEQANKILLTRDQEFRLRVSTLLFSKAISESMFASVMADFAVKLNQSNSEIREDLILHAKMFPKLYDINTTLTYPSTSDSDYESKVILWMKQKDKRRGYAKFLTQLFLRDLITEELMMSSIENVIGELNTIAKQSKTEQTEENTTQYVDFLFESSKLLPVTSAKIREHIKKSISEILLVSRSELPSLGMRSRFRLEDALKCVQ